MKVTKLPPLHVAAASKVNAEIGQTSGSERKLDENTLQPYLHRIGEEYPAWYIYRIFIVKHAIFDVAAYGTGSSVGDAAMRREVYLHRLTLFRWMTVNTVVILRVIAYAIDPPNLNRQSI